MPSILSDEDKLTVKRTVPKSANKIHAVAVAKLYVAYPDRHNWTYTGLQGAAVLANDLVGNTFWIKLVDISVSKRRHQAYATLILCSLPTVASSGTRRYTTPLPTTKIAYSSTLSSSNNAWPGYHSPTRRRLRLSRRSWTTAKRTPTRIQRTSPSAQQQEAVGLPLMGRAMDTASWEDCLGTGIPRIQHRRRNQSYPHQL